MLLGWGGGGRSSLRSRGWWQALVSISRFQQQSEKFLGELTNSLSLIRVLKEIWELTVFALLRVSKGYEVIQHKRNSAACITCEFPC